MDAPRTASGSPCKLCLKKGPGGRCHLHGGTPKKWSRSPSSAHVSPKTPKKSPSPKWKGTPRTKAASNLDDLFGTFGSPKKSAKGSPKSAKVSPKEFHYLNALPKPALQQVLLNMGWNDLRRTCSHVPAAWRICRENNFRQLYLARNRGPLFLGLRKIKTTEDRGAAIFAYLDSRGVKVEMEYFPAFGESVLKIWFTPDLELTIELNNIGDKLQGSFIETEDGALYGQGFDAEVKRLFNAIQRPEWYAAYVAKNEKWREIMRAIVMELKNAIGANTKDAKKLDALLQ